jgi:hypothetical protein
LGVSPAVGLFVVEDSLDLGEQRVSNRKLPPVILISRAMTSRANVSSGSATRALSFQASLSAPGQTGQLRERKET